MEEQLHPEEEKKELEQPEAPEQEPEEEEENDEPISPTEESRLCISSAIEAYQFLESIDDQGALPLKNDLTDDIRRAMTQCIRVVCSEVPRLLDSEELKKEINTDW